MNARMQEIKKGSKTCVCPSSQAEPSWTSGIYRTNGGGKCVLLQIRRRSRRYARIISSVSNLIETDEPTVSSLIPIKGGNWSNGAIEAGTPMVCMLLHLLPPDFASMLRTGEARGFKMLNARAPGHIRATAASSSSGGMHRDELPTYQPGALSMVLALARR